MFSEGNGTLYPSGFFLIFFFNSDLVPLPNFVWDSHTFLMAEKLGDNYPDVFSLR